MTVDEFSGEAARVRVNDFDLTFLTDLKSINRNMFTIKYTKPTINLIKHMVHQITVNYILVRTSNFLS